GPARRRWPRRRVEPEPQSIGLTRGRPYAERVPNKGSYRVVQWTTGNVGKSSVAAIAKNPHSELVGLYAWSDDNPMWIDVDELVRILEAGVNVVATASFITGHNQGGGRDRIAEACRRGGSTMFG